MRHDQNESIYDVVISGAGPVGLMLACELALAKCSVLILEKAADPNSVLKKLPFGIRGLSSPSIEALNRRGLLDDLEIHKRMKNPHMTKAPESPAQRQAGHFAGIAFYDGHIDRAQWTDRLPSSTATSLISEMAELETVLSRRAEISGVEIRRGLSVTGYQQSEAGVTVQSGDGSFKCCWLVGCDGSRSVVRKLGGFDFAGTEPEFTGYTMQVELVDAHKLKPGRNPTPTGMYMQSQPGYLMVQEFDGGAFHATGQPVTLETAQAVLRRVSGTDVTLSALHVATTWTDRARQATSYRNGRVLLAGDAAHIHSPLGGQGLNLGIGDAMNLGWKLAATIHGQAPQDLLDTYQAERHPIGAQVLDWSRAQVALMMPDSGARALHAVVRDLMGTREVATYFAAKVWGIFNQHGLVGDHPLIGRSVPSFEFADGSKVDERLREGRGLLLDFGPRAALETLAGEIGDGLRYVAGSPLNSLGLSAVLVRPDGMVAWASQGEPDVPSLRQAAGLWFRG